MSSSPDELELEDDDEELDKVERSVKTAVVLISEQVEDTLELMLEGTSLSCEEATPLSLSPLPLLLDMSAKKKKKKDGDNGELKGHTFSTEHDLAAAGSLRKTT